MSPRERRLALVLAFALAAGAAAVGFAYFLERLGEARSEIGDYRLRIERLSGVTIDEGGARAKLGRIADLVEKAELHRSAASSVSIAAFGREAMELLSTRRIAPGKYSVLPGDRGEQIELSLECRAVDLLSFLKSATESKGWSVPYLSLRADAGGRSVDAVLRLGR